jgi:hypothetical protein
MDRHRGTPAGIEQRARAEASAHVGAIYTPDTPIFDPALFSGRARELNSGRRLLATRGATLVIYGPRGVGKTSLANVLLHDRVALRRNASKGVAPLDLFSSMLIELEQHMGVTETTTKGTVGFSAAVRVGGELSEKRAPIVSELIDVNFLTTRLGQPDLGVDAFVIDEVQEIEDEEGRLTLAALSKAWADAGAVPLLVLIGAGDDARDVLGESVEHYGGRHVHAIEVDRLDAREVHDLLQKRAALGIGVSAAAARGVALLSLGQPWIVQRLMLDAVHSWLDHHQWTSQDVAKPNLLRVFNKRVTSVDLRALNITVEVAHLEEAADAFVVNTCRRHRIKRPAGQLLPVDREALERAGVPEPTVNALVLAQGVLAGREKRMQASFESLGFKKD